jgi:hypothetical protein
MGIDASMIAQCTGALDDAERGWELAEIVEG